MRKVVRRSFGGHRLRQICALLLQSIGRIFRQRTNRGRLSSPRCGTGPRNTGSSSRVTKTGITQAKDVDLELMIQNADDEPTPHKRFPWIWYLLAFLVIV